MPDRQAVNNETAQYTSRIAMIVFTTLVCLENSHLNTEPKPDHRSVNRKPIKASRRAKHKSVKGLLL